MNKAIQPCVSMRGEEGKAGSLKTQGKVATVVHAWDVSI